MDKLKNFFMWIRASKIRALLAVIVIVTLGFVDRSLLSGNKQKQEYQTVAVEKSTIVSTVSASGTVTAANIISITTTASGVVSAVYVKDGDHVVQGQKIADLTLDSAGAQKSAAAWSSYLSAKNAVDSAQVALWTTQSDMLSKWDTYKELAEGDNYENADGTPKYDQRALPEFKTVENDWLAAEAKYKNQQSIIAQSQAALNSSWLSYQLSSPTILAPMNGVISNITIAAGMTLSSSTSTTDTNNTRITIIRSEGTPIISFNVSEIDIPKVKQGQKATVTLDSLGDKTFTGTVLTVDRIGSVSSGVTNYTVNIQLDLANDEILPNMAATANIILESKSDVLIVPSSALQTQNGEPFAKVLKNGKEQLVPVEVGISSDTQTEIISGLSVGDTVITGTVSNDASTTQTRSIFSGGLGGGTRVQMVR